MEWTREQFALSDDPTLATQDAHGFYEQLGFVRREVLRRYPGADKPPAY